MAFLGVVVLAVVFLFLEETHQCAPPAGGGRRTSSGAPRARVCAARALDVGTPALAHSYRGHAHTLAPSMPRRRPRPGPPHSYHYLQRVRSKHGDGAVAAIRESSSTPKPHLQPPWQPIMCAGRGLGLG
jgi:hypothetical protein